MVFKLDRKRTPNKVFLKYDKQQHKYRPFLENAHTNLFSMNSTKNTQNHKILPIF